MARPGRPERNRAARSFRQLRRFHHDINSNKVFGTHSPLKTSKTSETYKSLKSDLLNGHFAPGAQMRIDAISKSLDVSVGAVREALSRLTSDGIVENVPQKGFVVAPVSPEDLKDLTSVRIDIESR